MKEIKHKISKVLDATEKVVVLYVIKHFYKFSQATTLLKKLIYKIVTKYIYSLGWVKAT